MQPWRGALILSWIGVAIACWAWAEVIEPYSAILLSTVSRRCLARAALLTGSYMDGDWTSPASRAACGKAQVLGVHAEVALRGRLDAVRLLTEEGDVEVVGEDLVLGQGLLQLDRVAQLLDLAAEGLALGFEYRLLVAARLLDEDVLDVLLGEGGGTLGDASAGRVLVQRAQYALEIHGSVLVEAVVLDVDQCLAHDRRDLVTGYDGAVTVVDGGDEPPVGVVDPRRLRQRGRLELVGQAVEALRGGFGAHPQRARHRQRDAGGHRARQDTHSEEPKRTTEGGSGSIRTGTREGHTAKHTQYTYESHQRIMYEVSIRLPGRVAGYR